MSIRGICKQFYWKVIGFGIRAFIQELRSIHSAVVFLNYYNFLCDYPESTWPGFFCIGGLSLVYELLIVTFTNSDEKFNIHKEKSKAGLLSYHK